MRSSAKRKEVELSRLVPLRQMFQRSPEDVRHPLPNVDCRIDTRRAGTRSAGARRREELVKPGTLRFQKLRSVLRGQC